MVACGLKSNYYGNDGGLCDTKLYYNAQREQ